MDFSFILAIVAAAIVLTLLRKLRFHQEDNREENVPSSSPSSSLSPVSDPPPSSSRIWTHHVFPSFRGEDVRRNFLSHVQMEFERKGITPFIDNEIKRGESIGPELISAIRGSKIAIILLSRNYASSKWCLDELVEIMKCREELGQIVMAVFYEVDPSDVKKLTGDFGKVFRKTCAGKKKENIERWKQALEKVATIAGYHSINWDNEAAMIKKIATDISNMLNNFTPSNDFIGLVGMGAHLEKMKPLLCLDSDEVRMIGIWGLPGIGKTTIARAAYNQLSNGFQLSVFMDDIKAKYSRLCSDDYNAKLQLQQQFMSQITNHKDMVVSHLGVLSNRLKDKKVLVVIDGVDRSLQLDAIAKETRWFGPGSRIIITTQDHRLLIAHGINHIYKVNLPTNDEALQIFCTYCFGQKYPKNGFEELAREVTGFAGELPLGLRVMGSYFRRMSKQEWISSLPRLRTSLNADIKSILKFSYDALDDEDKDLFLHIACFFNLATIVQVEEHLAKNFLGVRQRLKVLAEKSLISIRFGYISMHSLLEKLGREIVWKQSIHEPGQRQFLYDKRDICELLTGDSTGTKSVIGIYVKYEGEGLDISEKAFEGMSNLQFLKVYGDPCTLQLNGGLNYLPPKLRLLEWKYFPMTCFPCNVNFEFIVELIMTESKLEKLWEGIKSLPRLKWMDLRDSVNLKELPDLSTATNLEKLNLCFCSSLIKLPSLNGNSLEELDMYGCSSLVEFPSFIGNVVNLRELDLSDCLNLVELPELSTATELVGLNLQNCSSLIKLPFLPGNSLKELDISGWPSLVEFPSFIGNATNLRKLDLSDCSNLLELPLSLGNLHKLQRLILKGCSKLEVLPTNINLQSLVELNLCDCSMLKSFPQISTNIRVLNITGTAIEQVPPSIRSWPRLEELQMSYFENLKEFPHALERITELCFTDTEIQEVPPWVKKMSRLNHFELKGCRELVSLPPISDSISSIDASDCESLEILECSFPDPNVWLNFANCFKLNQEARDLIIQNSTKAILPGGKVPAYFTHRAIGGGPLTIKLTEKPLPQYMRLKAYILLLNKGDHEACSEEGSTIVMYENRREILWPALPEHLYTFWINAEVTSSELLFDFKLKSDDIWKIGECGLVLSSDILNHFTPSNDFDGFVGMRAHLEKIEPLLCLGSDEVRMIGIWGPPGIGKTTIARVAYSQLSDSFQLSVFMDDLKANNSRLCSDDYSLKLQLQQQFMSQITNHKDMVVSHLGVVSNRLKDKKVLVVLDGVDRSVQLDAIAKEIGWFGPGSRIIITTQDQRVFRAHGINHIYKVNLPTDDEALQIFCTYCFGQKSPKDGFEELAREVTRLSGELPLGLRVMGSYFRGMSTQEWVNSLPRLKTSLDADIRSILKFSYDALDDEDKDLFLHIACFFNHEYTPAVEEYLAKNFLGVRQRLNVLAEKSLIFMTDEGWGNVKMHSLLEKLGKEIVCKQSIHEPGQRQFLYNEREIREVLTGDSTGSKSVIGINLDYSREGKELYMSEKAFAGMSNLQFLRVDGYCDKLQLNGGLNCLPHKLRLLEWSHFPMTCFPCNVNFEFLVKLEMPYSKLEKLWEGTKKLGSLRCMDLSDSVNLKELPDLSTATNLEELNLRNCSSLLKLPSLNGNSLEELDISGCSSLVDFPSCIGNAINLRELDLRSLPNLVELPSYIGNATNLERLDLSDCLDLVELPLSLGNLQKLEKLILKGCSKLQVLPTNINLESLNKLDLSDCFMLKRFSQISTNIENLDLLGTAIEQVPPSIRSWPRLKWLQMSYFENLKEFPHALERITELWLTDTEIQELPPCVNKISHLYSFVLKGCRKLVSLPPISDSISYVNAIDCESLEILECSFHFPYLTLNFANCFKLNQEARDLIIQTSSSYAVLPGGKVPAYFTHRAIGGGPLTIKLTEKPLPQYMRLKACILLLNKGDHEACSEEGSTIVMYENRREILWPALPEHLYTFWINAEVTSSELLFEFKLKSDDIWKIGECGLVQDSE